MDNQGEKFMESNDGKEFLNDNINDSKETDSKEVDSKEVDSKEVDSKEVDSKETDSKEDNSKKTNSDNFESSGINENGELPSNLDHDINIKNPLESSEIPEKLDKPKENNFLKETLKWIAAIAAALVVSLVLRSFVFEFVVVDGPSMQNTMFTGQRLVMYKLGYNFSFPKRGDIVVFKFREGNDSGLPILKDLPFSDRIIPKSDEVDYIKRVIAVPGDKVDIKDGHVYVNDEKLNEPYAVGVTNSYGGLNFPIEKIPPNKIFAVGDNREQSSDSRMIGLIDISQVKGRAIFRIYPFNKIGLLN